LSELNKTEVAQHFLEKFQDLFSRSRIAISVVENGQIKQETFRWATDGL